mgnify:CR=1 FL=1
MYDVKLATKQIDWRGVLSSSKFGPAVAKVSSFVVLIRREVKGTAVKTMKSFAHTWEVVIRATI